MEDTPRRRTYLEKLQDSRWQEKRLRVMEKSGEGGFTCMWCGAGKGSGVTLNVDHAYYKRGAEPWEYDDESLWCLCRPCHDEAGQIREEVHRIIATMHPAFLKSLGLNVSEFVARLAPLRQEVKPTWGPIHCRRCGVQVGKYLGMLMTVHEPTGPRTYQGLYQRSLDKVTAGRCVHCGFELAFEDTECTDDYLPSLPEHAREVP